MSEPGPGLGEPRAGHLVHRVRPGRREGPAILLLHGLTGDESSMAVFLRQLPEGLPALTVRAPHRSAQGGHSWFRDEDRGRPEAPTTRESLRRLEDFLAEDLLGHASPQAPLFLIGFSQGAYMSYLLAPRLGQRLRGLVGMSSFPLPQELLPEGSLRGVDALLLHGSRDELVPLGEGRRAAERLRRAGARVDFREYPTRHKVTRDGMKALRDWLAARAEQAAG